ncbi:MAG: RluA family pseudouridine synthase [Verrucomicrobia subdivision 3 bacterium]|nr:RluA family pseudouridine synthase [Limisphaerales bacterium]
MQAPLVASNPEPLVNVLHEDDALLVVNKPAGLVCHPTKGDAFSSLIGRVRVYLGETAHPHLINRLDRETSGVTLIAKNDATALGLRKLWERREVRKGYLAIVHGHVREDHGIIDAPLGKDKNSSVAIKDCVLAGGAPAQTAYAVKCRFSRAEGDFSLLEVEPLTGRKHQLRIHLAHIGHPIVGDKLYGPDEQIYLDFVNYRLTAEQRARLILPCHALHASEVNLAWRGKPWSFAAEPEPGFPEFIPSPIRWHRAD